jgi:hypothetical protein
MVAKQLRTVFFTAVPRQRNPIAGGVSPQIRFVFEVCVVASNYPEEGCSASDGGDSRAKLPFRANGPDHPVYAEARAELRDRETYYTELRFAVHCQSRSIPAPRAALDDRGSDTWIHDVSRTNSASGTSGTSGTNSASAASGASGTNSASGTSGDSWDQIVAHFGDTWT